MICKLGHAAQQVKLVAAAHWRVAAPRLTRATPASTSALLQGGVRPWWLHGSSVT